MTEIINAYLILWEADFIDYNIYIRKIDELFSNYDNNDLLLELEFCSKDIKENKCIFNEYIFQNKIHLDTEKVGILVLNALENIYITSNMDIYQFAHKSYKMYLLLPNDIMMDEPFWTFSYADDCLSYGDEKQTRELYEKAFNFYKVQEKS